MKFITDISEEKYEKFMKNNEYAHFMQSYRWGKFQEIATKRKAYYLGVVDDNENLIFASMGLKKSLYLGYSYLYLPRAFCIDYKNKELLDFFVNEFKKFCKQEKIIFVKIDPAFVLKKVSNDEKIIEKNKDKDIFFKNLFSLGFISLGLNKLFESSQPRFTYRIDLTKSEEDILNNFSKTLKKRIKKCENFDIEIEEGDSSDIEEFYRLMRLTEERKTFIQHDISYYKDLFSIYNQGEYKVKLYKAYVYPKKVIKNYEDKIKRLTEEIEELKSHENYKKSYMNELLKQIEDSKNYIKEYTEVLNNYKKDKIILNAHIIIYYKDMCWALYAGNETVLLDSCSNYGLYKYHILDAKKNKCKFYDNFGAVSLDKKDHPLFGLNTMKQSFGGDFYEFSGEFDLVINKFFYQIFKLLIPIRRKIKYFFLKHKK